jgi:ABC-type glycerol-3-phosphate transport system permease component
MATQAQVPQVPHRTLAMALVSRIGRPTLGMVVTNIILLALVVVMVIPYLYMALSSFKVNSEIFSYPLTLWPT